MMKTLYKIVYYLTIAFSAFILCLHLSFGGIGTVFYIIREGFYSDFSRDSLIYLRLGQVIAGLFFLTCILCVLLPLTRFQQPTKYKLAFVFFLVLSCIFLISLMIKVVNLLELS